jgi:hypothetical protein
VTGSGWRVNRQDTPSTDKGGIQFVFVKKKPDA